MATKTRDQGNSAEKRNTISEINITLTKHFSGLAFVNSTLAFVSSR